jgi:hypothetical protein
LLYAAIFNGLASVVTGSIFKIQSLLVLFAFVFIETGILGVAQTENAGFWLFANIVVIEIGYLAGVGVRALVEHVDHLRAAERTRRTQ